MDRGCRPARQTQVLAIASPPYSTAADLRDKESLQKGAHGFRGFKHSFQRSAVQACVHQYSGFLIVGVMMGEVELNESAFAGIFFLVETEIGMMRRVLVLGSKIEHSRDAIEELFTRLCRQQ